MVAPIFVGREKSISAIEARLQRADARSSSARSVRRPWRTPPFDDLRPVGRRAPGCCSSSSCRTAASRRWSRATSASAPSAWSPSEPHFVVEYAPVESTDAGSARSRSLARRVADEFVRYVQLHPQLADEAQFVVQQADDPDELADIVAAHLQTEAGREAGAAGDREHAAAPPRPAREPRRGERRARHRAGDRPARCSSASRARSARCCCTRSCACCATRSRRPARRPTRTSRELRAARRRGGRSRRRRASSSRASSPSSGRRRR